MLDIALSRGVAEMEPEKEKLKVSLCWLRLHYIQLDILYRT